MELAFYAAGVRLPRRPEGVNLLLARLFKKEKTKCASLSYIFCSDEYLLNINREFLMHDDYTDIITFDLSDRGDPVQGEIYISIQRVKDNAAEFKVPFKDELLRVMIHGALHLCGYKDKSKADKLDMRAKEEEYLRMFNRAQ